jgi:4-hydroxy-4-methyl-2-oxoglutarate aldolase
VTAVPDMNELTAGLLELGTATLYEASGLECFLPASLQPGWPGATVVGTAPPVRTTPGDNLPLHLALEEARRRGARRRRMRCAARLLERGPRRRRSGPGVLGLVIDGGVRDTGRLAALAGVQQPGRLGRDRQGRPRQRRGPIRFGRAIVARGDMVVADHDGVVILPAARVGEILASSRDRARKEAGYLDPLRADELTLAFTGSRAGEAAGRVHPRRRTPPPTSWTGSRRRDVASTGASSLEERGGPR